MQNTFTNEPINIGEIPTLEDQNYIRLHPSYLKISLISFAIGAAIVIIGSIIGAVFIPMAWIPLAIGGVLLLLLALGAYLKTIEVKYIGYQIRENDISLRSGVIVKGVNTIPYVRVQHVEKTQGFVSRKFAIASLLISTAGPDLRIPALAQGQADQLKQLIISRAGKLVENK